MGKAMERVFNIIQTCWFCSVTLCDPMDCRRPSFPVLHHVLELAQTHVHWAGDAIQPSRPHPLLLLPSVFPSIRVFSNESALHIRSIGASASASVLLMNIQDWFPLIDWFDLLVVQGTLGIYYWVLWRSEKQNWMDTKIKSECRDITRNWDTHVTREQSQWSKSTSLTQEDKFILIIISATEELKCYYEKSLTERAEEMFPYRIQYESL